MKKTNAIFFCVMCFMGVGFSPPSFANTQGNLTREVLSIHENKKLPTKAIKTLEKMVKFSQEKCTPPHHDYVVIYISGVYEEANKSEKNSAHRRALRVKRFVEHKYKTNYSLEISIQPINSSEIRLGGMADVLQQTSNPVYVAISC